MARIVRVISGILVIILGVVGLLLPIFPGWVVIVLGAVLLSFDIPLFKRLVCWIERQFPPFTRILARIRRLLGRGTDRC